MQLPEYGKLVEARRASQGPEIQQDISAPQPFERDLLPGGEFAALEGIGERTARRFIAKIIPLYIKKMTPGQYQKNTPPGK